MGMLLPFTFLIFHMTPRDQLLTPFLKNSGSYIAAAKTPSLERLKLNEVISWSKENKKKLSHWKLGLLAGPAIWRKLYPFWKPKASSQILWAFSDQRHSWKSRVQTLVTFWCRNTWCFPCILLKPVHAQVQASATLRPALFFLVVFHMLSLVNEWLKGRMRQ